MPQSTTDRNLLFGVLALQMDFITQDALITAMNTWVSQKDKPLGQILRSQKALDEEQDELLDALARKLMEKHGGDTRRTLAAVSATASVREELGKIGDHELSLCAGCLAVPDVAPGRAPDVPAPHAAGAAGTAGPRFRLLHFHDQGGLGEVWVAHDAELNREVALKRLKQREAANPQSRARFLHEAEVTGRLEHKGIVPVYGLGHLEDGRPFYAMRFVAGTTLKKAIIRFYRPKGPDPTSGDRSLELRRLLGRFVDVCNTVAYAHSRGVLHRDLKPGNIILDEYGETLVLDWGLAKSGCRDSDPASNGGGAPLVSAGRPLHTMTGTAIGTPAFMSPEQAAGRIGEVGMASDVYSLGATLYCLLTGKPPFEGRDTSLILAKVRAGEFPRPRQVEPRVPVALEAICLKAMALSPDGRYSTARALGDDIERWLADQPVLAYPEPFSARAMRWVRRRKQWVAAAAAMLIFTVLGLAIHDMQITREQRRTTDQLAMTRDALRELLKVSGENLAFIPNTERLREYLARLVLEQYRQLGERFPREPGVRLETAQVFRVIGGIGRLTGQFADSQAAYQDAIEELAALCRDDPGRADYRRWLVEALTDRGELYHMNGRTADAEGDFRAAIGHAEKLLSGPAVPPYRSAMASALIDLSEVLALQARHAEAYAAADRAVSLLIPLAPPDPLPGSTTRDRWLLSLALTDRGVAAMEAGDRDGAVRDLDEAARVAGAVARDDEVYDDAQFQLACIANQRGELLSRQPATFVEAERSYEDATRILARLITDHKLIPHYREEMAAALCGRAGVRLAMESIPDAQGDCEAALGHLGWLTEEQARKGAPENPQYLSLLGQVLSRQSRIQFRRGRSPEGKKTHAEAVKKLSRAVELDPARAADRAKLERIQAGPDQPKN
jgi:serine/threonine-protein kinase